MAPGYVSWRIVVCAALLVLLVEESVAGRISSSRHGRRPSHRRRHIWPIRARAQQANEVDDRGGGGAADGGGTTSTTVNGDAQTSASRRSSLSRDRILPPTLVVPRVRKVISKHDIIFVSINQSKFIFWAIEILQCIQLSLIHISEPTRPY